MDLIMPQVFDRIKAASGELVRCKKYNIGPWNMDVDYTKDVTWTWADLTKILSVEAMILRDDLMAIYPLCALYDQNTGTCRGGIFMVSNTYIRLFRTNSMLFDSLSFDDAVMNRGYIYVWYVE